MASSRHHPSPAFSLVELVSSMAIMALLLVGAVSISRSMESQKSNVAAERFAACIEQARHAAIARRVQVLVSMRKSSDRRVMLGLWDITSGSGRRPIGRERELPDGVEFNSDDLTKQSIPHGSDPSEGWVLVVDRHGRLCLPEGSEMVTVALHSKAESKARTLRIARSTARVLPF